MGKEKVDEEETYEIGVICDNCGNYHCFNIPKGVLIEEYTKTKNIEETKCEECGCLLKNYEIDMWGEIKMSEFQIIENGYPIGIFRLREDRDIAFQRYFVETHRSGFKKDLEW